MGNGASTAYAGGVLGVELDGGIGRSLSAVVCSHVRFISNIKYSSERSGRQFEYQLSLHDTEQDLVVSKLLLESNGTYGTVSEVHAVCEGGQDGGYGIDCEKGKTFVEVGSALGHVSMYMATRGMRVVAIDPLEANIERVQESMCLNGVATCLKGSPPRSTGAQEREGDRCSQSSEWLSYSPKHVLAIFALVSNEANESLTLVESEPYNLAATIKGECQSHPWHIPAPVHIINGRISIASLRRWRSSYRYRDRCPQIYLFRHFPRPSPDKTDSFETID
jgi:hypothetical protein